ncbi:replication protein A 70 kDa DNA-binding subunit C-like [Pyrus ussuriensis x Pyrus communis]|uniref:Replication protein A 70 kDa DNA-binding subunit C-like n=1 Tax=Pyrus ussuriensis x Pyrus communis TaxID=2448454 RepID=A0A5N5EWB8_9ROSA|nr:replication protein A 70 kDa DNA-binding subunit C-like [Pyrus ussuriensis x Pyrus communis]
MENEGPTPLDQLAAYKKIVRIKVRVCRIWRPKYPGMGDKYTGLHCILVDEKQQAIESSFTEMDYEIIVPKIEAGTCYEIMNFRTNYARAQYRVVPHETQIIFISKTVFKKLASVFPPIPRHIFFLQDCNKLYPRLNKCDILTDVIGHLISVQPVEPIQINQRIEDKCDLVIQNIRNEEAKITLWSDVAHAFSAFSLEQLHQPIIIVFTSLKVKLFGDSIILNNTGSTLFFIDPDIPELNTYKSVFSTWPHPIKTLPPSKQANEQDIFQTGKKMTLEELGYLDPDLYKNDTFLCKASIKRYNTKYEWWYKVFLVLEDETDEISALIIGRSGEKVFGVPCKDLVFNQRSVDQKQLPSEFLRLIGQKKIYHLRFGSRRNSLNSNDLLIYNISEELTIQPTTPQSLSKQVTVSSTAVSSSSTPVDIVTDSPVDIIAGSHKRKRESIRRALFVPFKTSQAEEICETDAQDQDQIPIKLFKRKSSPTSS